MSWGIGTLGSSSSLDRFRQPCQPLRRTPRPKSWMAWEPSPFAKLMRPMVETRQLFQPSVNFREPISTFTLDSFLLMPRNRDSEANSSVLVTIPLASQSLIRPEVSPMLMTPKYSPYSPTFSPISPDTWRRLSTCSRGSSAPVSELNTRRSRSVKITDGSGV